MAQRGYIKNFEIDGDIYEINSDTHNALNHLAAKFYEQHGNSNPVDFDFYSGAHPQERLMYALALNAYAFNLKYGF